MTGSKKHPKYKGCIIRQRGKKYQVEISHGGSRFRYTAATVDEAKVLIDQKLTEIVNQGIRAFDLNENQKADAVVALEVLSRMKSVAEASVYSSPLVQAARFWAKHHPEEQAMPLSVVLNRYVEYKTKRNLRPTSIKEIKNRVGRFITTSGDRDVRCVTKSDIEAWLSQYAKTDSAWTKYHNQLRQFFRFAQGRGHIADNPLAEKAQNENAVADTEIEIYSAAEVERLLRAAEADWPSLVPVLAIGFFAGLRPAEIDRLDWAHVNIETRQIIVTSQTAKRRRRRKVSMCGSLVEWLLPFRKESGSVSPSDAYTRKHRKALLRKAGIDEWIHDGLRHTYGSMHVEKHGSREATAKEMGHRDLRVLIDHYATAIDDPTEADAYWSILPLDLEQVVQFRTA